MARWAMQRGESRRLGWRARRQNGPRFVDGRRTRARSESGFDHRREVGAEAVLDSISATRRGPKRFWIRSWRPGSRRRGVWIRSGRAGGGRRGVGIRSRRVGGPMTPTNPPRPEPPTMPRVNRPRMSSTGQPRDPTSWCPQPTAPGRSIEAHQPKELRQQARTSTPLDGTLCRHRVAACSKQQQSVSQLCCHHRHPTSRRHSRRRSTPWT